jgi:hypothetical protein
VYACFTDSTVPYQPRGKIQLNPSLSTRTQVLKRQDTRQNITLGETA